MLDVEKIVRDRLKQYNESVPEDFGFKEVDRHNMKYGVFPLKNSWFLYETTTKNLQFFRGPFTDKEIIYACALKLGKHKYFTDYMFSDEAEEKYLYHEFTYSDIKDFIGE